MLFLSFFSSKVEPVSPKWYKSNRVHICMLYVLMCLAGFVIWSCPLAYRFHSCFLLIAYFDFVWLQYSPPDYVPIVHPLVCRNCPIFSYVMLKDMHMVVPMRPPQQGTCKDASEYKPVTLIPMRVAALFQLQKQNIYYLCNVYLPLPLASSEVAQGRTVCYLLSNFVFGGNIC